MIGINTYGLGINFHEDFEDSLNKLKEIGFDAIEPCILSWGDAVNPAKNGGPKLSERPALQGMCLVEDAAEWVAKFRENGFLVRSAHFMGHFDDREGMDRAVQFAIDNDIHYFIHSFNVPTIADIRAWIPDIRATIEKLQAHGITMLMHNHEVEWTPDEGTTVLDYLMQEVPELGLQLDVGWTKFAGADCVETMKKYKDRIRIIHFKDVEEGAGVHNRNSCFTAVGEGSIPLKEIMALAPELALDEMTGFVIDQDASKDDMMRDLRVGLQNIKKSVKPVHVGVIGAGMISGSYLNAMTKKFEILQVDAVADINMKAAESAAEKYGIRACTVEEILADESLEMIVNLTPPAAHEEIFRRSLEAGKHVYTEKCYMTSTESAARINQLADEKGLCVGTAPDTFFSGWMQTARNFIDSGKLGRITSFAMVGNRDYDLLLSIMAYLRKEGGGVIQDYSVYYLTALINLLGPVKKVSAYVKAPYPTRVNISERSPQYGETIECSNESQFYSTLELENGITGTFAINADSALYDQTYFAIYGSKGILYLGCPDWFNGEVRFYENHYDFSKAAFPVRELVENPYGYNVDSRGVGAADMAWAIRLGRDVRASKERAYHVLDIQECMFKSHEQNGAFVEVQSTCERSKPLSVPTDGEESSLI